MPSPSPHQVWLARSILSNITRNTANRSLFYKAELRLKAISRTSGFNGFNRNDILDTSWLHGGRQWGQRKATLDNPLGPAAGASGA